jgi:hypothetical protein
MYNHDSELIRPVEIADRIYNVCASSKDQPGLNIGHGVKSIRFYQGNLLIDDIHVVLPRFGKNFVSWRQLTKSHYTSGYLYFMSGGVTLSGMITIGTTKADAVTYSVIASFFPLVDLPLDHEPSAALLTGSQPRKFNTWVTKQPYPVTVELSKLPDSAWQPGYTFSLGYDTTQHQQIVYNGDPDNGGTDLSTVSFYQPSPLPNTVQLVINDSDNTEFDCTDTYTGAVGVIQASITITMLSTSTFTGTITSCCPADPNNPTPPEGEVYFWKGTTASQLAAPAKPTLLTTADILEDTSLNADTLATLMVISQDDKQNVQNMAQNLLVENMKWAISQNSDEVGWLTTFYGENPPVLSDNRKALINQSLSWYQTSYAKAQLSWQAANYSGESKPATQFSDDQTLKLKYYLMTGIAKESDFNLQQQGIYNEAYILSVPKIQPYLNDNVPDENGKTGGEKWAQALYDDVYTPNLPIWISAYRSAGTPDANQLNAACELLMVLQPTGVIAQQFYNDVVVAVLGSQSVKTDIQTVDNTAPWLTDWLQVFLATAASNPAIIPDEWKLATEQANDLVQNSANGAADVALSMANILSNAPGSSVWTVCQAAEDSWANQYPKWSIAGKLIFVAAFSFGIQQIVGAYSNWKNLGSAEKGKTVIATVGFAAQLMQTFPEILTMLKAGGSQLKQLVQKLINWVSSKLGGDVIFEIGESVDANWVQTGIDETSALIDVEARVIKTEGTLWEKVLTSSALKIVLKVVAVIVAAAAAILSVLQLMSDLNTNQPFTKTVLDGLIAAADAVAAVCVVVDVIITSVVANVLGAVLAILGAIIAIIEAFVLKPENPLETFMTQVAIPFVNGLPSQTPPPGESSSTTVIEVVFA